MSSSYEDGKSDKASEDSDVSELQVTQVMKKNALEIKNHFNPETYKEKADLEVSKLKIIKALKAVLDTD